MKFWDGIQKLHILNLIILITGRMAAKRQLPVLKFTHRPKNQHFRPAGVTRSIDSRQIWHSRGAPGSTWPCSISSPVPGVGTRPLKVENFNFFGKESPHKRELLDRCLLLLWSSIRPTTLSGMSGYQMVEKVSRYI